MLNDTAAFNSTGVAEDQVTLVGLFNQLLALLFLTKSDPVTPLLQPYLSNDTNLPPFRRKIKFAQQVCPANHFEWCGFSSRLRRKCLQGLPKSQTPLLRTGSRLRRGTSPSPRKVASFLNLPTPLVNLPPAPSP